MKNIRLCWIAASLFCHFFMVFFLLFCFCQNFFISPKVRIRFPKSIRYLLTVHHSSQTSSSFAEPDCILLLTRIQELFQRCIYAQCSSLFSSILAIVRATKQVRKCASICSLVQTYTGLASSSLLVTLKDSSIRHNPRYISIISSSDASISLVRSM